MPPRKRLADTAADTETKQAPPKRRSSRQAAIVSARQNKSLPIQEAKSSECASPEAAKFKSKSKDDTATTVTKKAPAVEPSKEAKSNANGNTTFLPGQCTVDSIPVTNPEAPRHDGEWYWLMKAEPETRLENGIDVKFSIDDLRSKTKPEGWDGIRAYAARNHMRNMNAGDKAFFYHSNCKEPGIAGIMEIVREFSEDTSAREPGTPYYDPKSTKEYPRWSLVHVEFRKKFAVPITLKELRDLGSPGSPLENMQMLRQSRLSVSRVSKEEWDTLCTIADEKAKQAGLEHETGKVVIAGLEH